MHGKRQLLLGLPCQKAISYQYKDGASKQTRNQRLNQLRLGSYPRPGGKNTGLTREIVNERLQTIKRPSNTLHEGDYNMFNLIAIIIRLMSAQDRKRRFGHIHRNEDFSISDSFDWLARPPPL